MTPTGKILLIESLPEARELVGMFSSAKALRDYELSHCHSLAEGWELLQGGEEFAAILLDLSVSDSAGPESIEKLATQFPQSNIIALVDTADEKTRLKITQAGASNILIKNPLNSETLIQSLQLPMAGEKALWQIVEVRQNTGLGYWNYRPASGFFDASDELFRIFGCRPVQKPILLDTLGDGHFPLSFFQKLHEKVAAGREVNEEVKVFLKDKSPRYLSVQCYVQTQPGGEPNIYGVVQDMTGRQAAGRERQEPDRQDTKMNERFLSEISHEMRTPINAILGMSGLLLETELNAEQQSLIQSIRDSSEVLAGVVNNILELSAFKNGKIIFERKAFDLHGLLRSLGNVMQYAAHKKGIALKAIIAPDVPRIVRGDKLRLNQILYNLVGNAIKFTDTGFVKIRALQLRSMEGKAELRFEVEDTGIGIPEDKTELIFEAFARIQQKDRLFEGTGLGLSISKNLVEMQGGKIGATSAPGKGSVFYFELTFEKEEELSRPENLQPGTLLPGDSAFRLLLAEDHLLNQMVVRKTLERKWKNIDIEVVDNGQTAIDLLKAKDFDIVLMDLQMPIMDGYEAALYIRQRLPSNKANIPILVTTAEVQVDGKEELCRCGADDFVLKPIDPDELFYKISKYTRLKPI